MPSASRAATKTVRGAIATSCTSAIDVTMTRANDVSANGAPELVATEPEARATEATAALVAGVVPLGGGGGVCVQASRAPAAITASPRTTPPLLARPIRVIRRSLIAPQGARSGPDRSAHSPADARPRRA